MFKLDTPILGMGMRQTRITESGCVRDTGGPCRARVALEGSRDLPIFSEGDPR